LLKKKKKEGLHHLCNGLELKDTQKKGRENNAKISLRQEGVEEDDLPLTERKGTGSFRRYH